MIYQKRSIVRYQNIVKNQIIKYSQIKYFKIFYDNRKAHLLGFI